MEVCSFGVDAALRMLQGKRQKAWILVTYKRKVCERARGRRSGGGNGRLSENMGKSVGD